jgi:hypothetical protein
MKVKNILLVALISIVAVGLVAMLIRQYRGVITTGSFREGVA